MKNPPVKFLAGGFFFNQALSTRIITNIQYQEYWKKRCYFLLTNFI
ncbi:hypothetical protein ADICYQ_4419 [Cyclobacterium qasimii M12-11B]|uniref:Uncharacterized protein n=1 Tax=Cyclobacterium qasimii M12-11B TaxID=641524 RepID=S7V8H6_9BACT|nr:hypothetical protein ADICYQ_4419 [Cyclobacterium qasimii M12-11B]